VDELIADANRSDGPKVSAAQNAADEIDLQSAVSGLAQMVSGSRTLQDMIADVVGFAARAVPSVDGVAVALLRPENGGHSVQARSVTADFVDDIEVLQHEVLHEGPCLSCMAAGRPISSGSMGDDRRWPRFGPRAAELGVHSTLSVPLLIDGRVIGAINCFARDREAFGQHAVRLAERFAIPAAAVVHNAALLNQARDTIGHLERALNRRNAIDQAIGIMRSRHGDSADEAFDRLRHISQGENVKLAVVAQRIIDESVRKAP
jgi:GAF domain-containing protein